jgi:hypothetical protein
MISKHALTFSLLATLSIVISTIASAQVIPPPPQSVSRQAVARCESRVGSWKQQSQQDPQQKVYSPQPGWAIVSYSVVDEGAFGLTTKSWTSVPANFAYSSSTDVTAAYNDAMNVAIQAGLKGKELADFKAALDSSHNAYLAYHSTINSSHSAITLQTNAKGRGTFVDKGSEVAIHLDVVEIPIDPNLSSGAQFKAFVMKKTQDAIARAHKDGGIADPRGNLPVLESAPNTQFAPTTPSEPKSTFRPKVEPRPKN